MQSFDIFSILRLIAAICFLIYGMKLMKSSLEKNSGGLLEKTLEKCTKNDLRAVLFGTGVTALLQSSTAISVTVVSLADSGMLSLRRAIGVILGANVGTCVTAWLTSLTGLREDGLFFSLLKADSIAAIAIIGASLITIFNKNRSLSWASGALTGFSLMLFSLKALSDTLYPLCQTEAFKNAFTLFENPLMGILVGTVVTALLQSSSASVGILQATCAAGRVSVACALPIVLGQNIGTTITALAASAGSSVNARRSSFMHFFINLLGATVFLAVFFAIRVINGFDTFSESIDPAGVAWLHTLFNVVSTVALYPFIGALEGLAMGIGSKKERLAA